MAVSQLPCGLCCSTDNRQFFLDESTTIDAMPIHLYRKWSSCSRHCPMIHNRMRFEWRICVKNEFVSIPGLDAWRKFIYSFINCSYLLPASTWARKKSLKQSICCSFENSTWLAMFCKIFDISIRVRLRAGGTETLTISCSCGDTMAGLMNRKKSTVPTAPILFCKRFGKRLLNT